MNQRERSITELLSWGYLVILTFALGILGLFELSQPKRRFVHKPKLGRVSDHQLFGISGKDVMCYEILLGETVRCCGFSTELFIKTSTRRIT